MIQTFKILLVGDANVGKSTFVQRLNNGQFIEERDPTLGVELTPIRRNGNVYNIWECAGDERFKGLGSGYYVQAQGAIIMCDCSDENSFFAIEKYTNEITRVNKREIPILVY